MRKLFKVSFAEYWDDDSNIYIISDGFDEAAEKALIIKMKEQHVEIGTIDEDGDLITELPKPPKVRNVELLTENCYGIKDR